MHLQNRPTEEVAVSLDRIRDQLWDPDVCLYRVPPGATRNRAVQQLNLHSIRESALGALRDLAIGDIERAERTLRSVLKHQYPPSSEPWSGTFKVTAEESTPPREAVPFYHFDPNWRQFMGVILMEIWMKYQHHISHPLLDDILTAIAICVAEEPPSRIPITYTNPTLMKIWLQGKMGQLRADPQLLLQAEGSLRELLDRIDMHGDLDEYNSPTYDGICLMALALWQQDPPSSSFLDGGARILDVLTKRISDLFHPDLKEMTGPYIRAYHISFRTYVSLLGLWWSVLGYDQTLPPRLNEESDHCHDLFFFPLIEQISQPIQERLKIDSTFNRVHVQETGTIFAKSIIAETYSLGLEEGRRGSFARDQYTPLVVHWSDGAGGRTRSIGLQVDQHTNLDAQEINQASASFQIHRLDPTTSTPLTIKMLASDALSITHQSIDLDRCTIVFDETPSLLIVSPYERSMLTLRWLERERITGHLQIR